MKLKLLALCGLVALTGCATNKDYALYAETQQKIAQANAMAETARYAALAEIAKSGDSASRVAAVLSLNMGGGGQGVKTPQQVLPPRTIGDTALQWTSVLLPSLTNLYGINANRQVAITQSNNQAAIATSTNNTFAAMSNNMATSNSAIASTGFTAATTIANSGLTAVTTTAANGLTATKDVATAGITGVVTTAANGLTAVTTTAANGLTATSDVAKAGMTGIVTTGANGLTAATAISANANTTITNISNAANTSIQTLTNTIPNVQPNVTTTTSNNTTTNNNLTCPAGKALVNGSCV